MKPLLLYLLFFPLLLFSQQEPISISSRNGISAGINYNSFAKRFQEATYIEVRLVNPDFYHQRKIRKVELIQNDGNLFWSVEFDKSGRVVLEGKKGDYFFITKQRITDTLLKTDTLVLSYLRQLNLMRRDTIITHQFQYRQADTLMSFSRQTANAWYNGALINEQNEYYNTQFLHKRIKPEQRHNVVYDVAPGKHPNPRGQIYLHHKLKTNYDSSSMYLCIRETRDIEFSAHTTFGTKPLDITTLKKHPFIKLPGSKNSRKCLADGACFEEPIFYYDSYGCGSGMYRAQLERAQTSYGYTSGPGGLQDTYFTEHHPGGELLYGDQRRHSVSEAQRTTVLRFRYTWFE